MAKQEAQKIYIESKPNLFKATIKKVGREPGLKDEEKAVRFKSYIKELVLFKDGHEMIQFSQHEYVTNNEEDINFIKNSPAFGAGIWEGKFPQSVINKFDDDKKNLTRDEDYFNPPER